MMNDPLEERSQASMPAAPQVDILAEDFLNRMANGGKDILIALLTATRIAKKLSFHEHEFPIDEGDFVDLCTVIQGSSVKCLEVEYTNLSSRSMIAIAGVTTIPKLRLLSYDSVDEIVCNNLASMLKSNRAVTHLDLGDRRHGTGRVIINALEGNSTLTHLTLQKVSLQDGPSAIASLLRTNTRLMELDIGAENYLYPREGMLEIESILKYHNTSLTNFKLWWRHHDIQARCRKYLRRNHYLRLAKTLERPEPATFGAAIRHIAAENHFVTSGTAVFWLLQNNVRIMESLSKTKGTPRVLPAKRAIVAIDDY
jgi:hypothetical protein